MVINILGQNMLSGDTVQKKKKVTCDPDIFSPPNLIIFHTLVTDLKHSPQVFHRERNSRSGGENRRSSEYSGCLCRPPFQQVMKISIFHAKTPEIILSSFVKNQITHSAVKAG